MTRRRTVSDATACKLRAEYLAYVRGYGYLSRKYGIPESTVRDYVQFKTPAGFPTNGMHSAAIPQIGFDAAQGGTR